MNGVKMSFRYRQCYYNCVYSGEEVNLTYWGIMNVTYLLQNPYFNSFSIGNDRNIYCFTHLNVWYVLLPCSYLYEISLMKNTIADGIIL